MDKRTHGIFVFVVISKNGRVPNEDRDSFEGMSRWEGSRLFRWDEEG